MEDVASLVIHARDLHRQSRWADACDELLLAFARERGRLPVDVDRTAQAVEQNADCTWLVGKEVGARERWEDVRQALAVDLMTR